MLREDGTCWLNLGDSYTGGANSGGVNQNDGGPAVRVVGLAAKTGHGLKAKDLIGIPWRVAFALQSDGWYLRSDIIWHKPNPMPESVTDRPTKAHEYLFLLTKSPRYFYDAKAISEPATYPGDNRSTRTDMRKTVDPFCIDGGSRSRTGNPTGETINKRDVWIVPSQPYSGAHFATMPEALVEPCILAGCPLGGLVLDPFIGSGTVGAVASRLWRRWVGTDLAYQDLSAERTAQRGLMFSEATA